MICLESNSRASIGNLLLAVALLPLIGCGDKKTAAPNVVQQPNSSAPELPPEAAPESEPISQPTREAVTQDEESPEAEAAVETLTPLPERIVLLARGGPLLIDVWLTMDGRPYSEGIEALVDRVVQAGDTDEDGRSTWEEWRENEEFLQGELANLNPISQRTLNDWVKNYDENDDGRMQRVEAAAWLGRDGGRSARALRLRSSRSYSAIDVSQSRLWQILDNDENGRLSSLELELASERLLLLDTSDDRIVDAAELATLRDQLSGQNGQRSRYARQSRRDAAIHLRDSSEGTELDYILSDLYAPRQQIGPSSFSARPRLFAELDADGDQELDGSELGAMFSLEPHLKLAIEFGSKKDSSTTNLKIREQSAEIVQVLQTSDSRFVIATADTRLIVSAHDMSRSESETPTVQANQISLMVHDRGDGLFAELDTDANGKLGEREIFQAADQIRESDANGDRELDGNELPYSLTVAFVRGEAQTERTFYVPPVRELPAQQADSPPWFMHADLNADGDISRTEFLGSRAQFDALDKNRDHFISSAEASAYEQSIAEPRSSESGQTGS